MVYRGEILGWWMADGDFSMECNRLDNGCLVVMNSVWIFCVSDSGEELSYGCCYLVFCEGLEMAVGSHMKLLGGWQ